MTILNTYTKDFNGLDRTHFKIAMIMIFIIIVSVIVICTYYECRTPVRPMSKLSLFIIMMYFTVLVGVLFVSLLTSPPITENYVEAIIDENYPFTLVTDKYDFVERRGEIYVLKEREDYGEQVTDGTSDD